MLASTAAKDRLSRFLEGTHFELDVELLLVELGDVVTHSIVHGPYIAHTLCEGARLKEICGLVIVSVAYPRI